MLAGKVGQDGHVGQLVENHHEVATLCYLALGAHLYLQRVLPDVREAAGQAENVALAQHRAVVVPHAQVDRAGLVRHSYGAHLVAVLGLRRLANIQYDHAHVEVLLVRFKVFDEHESATTAAAATTTTCRI